jgi:CRP-like cAMP-binding protein
MNSFPEKNNPSQASEFQENLNLLRQIYFFSELPLETLKVLAYLCTRENFKQDEKIFSQGEDDGRAYYILSGKGILTRVVEDEEFSIRECDAGVFFGSLTLAGKLDRLFSLTAAVDTSCLILNREKFSKAIEQFPDLMPKVLQAIAESIVSWEEHFLNNNSDCSSCRNDLGASLL